MNKSTLQRGTFYMKLDGKICQCRIDHLCFYAYNIWSEVDSSRCHLEDAFCSIDIRTPSKSLYYERTNCPSFALYHNEFDCNDNKTNKAFLRYDGDKDILFDEEGYADIGISELIPFNEHMSFQVVEEGNWLFRDRSRKKLRSFVYNKGVQQTDKLVNDCVIDARTNEIEYGVDDVYQYFDKDWKCQKEHDYNREPIEVERFEDNPYSTYS